MADDASAPDEGTTEEQHETDGDLAVEATDAVEADAAESTEDTTEDEQDMAAEMQEIQDYLGEVDPDNVAAVGCVITLKEDRDWDDGDTSDGLTWRVLNGDLDGYDGTKDVLTTVLSFNEGLDQIEFPTEAPSGPAGMLGALMGD